MRKLLVAILCIALTLSCMSMGVFAAESTVYTVDAEKFVVSKVTPLTTVATFKGNITDAEVDVVNVDGTSMADTAYATENVFAKIDGELYRIDVDYPYDSVKYYGRDYRKDGDVLFEKNASEMSSSVAAGNEVMANSGFVYATSAYKIGEIGTTAPSLSETSYKTNITKQSENGEPVYVIENNAPRYTFLRSHYSSATHESSTQSPLTVITKGKVSVTTVSFKADMLGNVSLHHNAAGYATGFKGDGGFERFTYSDYAHYLPNSVHFTEEGKIKIGGTYTNGAGATDRTPAHDTGKTWEAGKKYTISVVQKVNDGGSRYAYVYGVYVNGEKVFPNASAATPGSQFSYSASKDAYSMTTRSNDYKYVPGGISSILIGAAPKNAGDNFSVKLTDAKVYTVASASGYLPEMDKDISLNDAENITVSEKEAEITDAVAEKVSDFKAKYSDVIIGIFNADGTIAKDTDYLATGMIVRIASSDGLQGKTYELTATAPVLRPQSSVYTVEESTKTVSKVAPLTTVADFLANFTNGDELKVVNIDGSEMASDAYATENVYLSADGELYNIDVKFNYDPLWDVAKGKTDGVSIYDKTADTVANASTPSSGFDRIQVYAKVGYGSDNIAPANTENQTVKGTKQTENGKPVYVMENDSNNYAYLRSHYSESNNNSTDLYTKTRIDYNPGKIVTTVEFEADKLGNISVFNNTPVRSKSTGKLSKGDSAVDGLIYGAELPYAPNSVHFMEDGSVKLGGTYANYTKAYRTPIQETDFTWEPGKKYTISIVQKYTYGGREAYVYGVYVNGTKIFPNDKTVGYTANNSSRVVLMSDGSFKIGTKDDETRHGGGLSSIMIGTAPKIAGENLTVTLSDAKVYTVSEYNSKMDADITLTSNNALINVDNEKAVIYAMKPVNKDDFGTTAKIKVEGDYLTAVSSDGLTSKTYTIVTDNVITGFYDGENGPEIKTLAEAEGNNICFTAYIDASSEIDGAAPLVFLAIYKNGVFTEYLEVTGTQYQGEVTKYKTVYDISSYDEDDKLEIRGFVWNSLNEMVPIAESIVID